MFKPSYETPNEATMKDNWGNPKPRESIPWTSLKDQIVPVWNYYYYDYDFRDDLNNAFNQVNKDIHFDGVSDYNVVMTYESPIKIDKTTLASAVLKAGVEIFVKGEPNTVMTGDWKMILKH